MPPTITIDPITRIEGHLSVKVETTNGVVTAAYAAGESFRGFEAILKGRHPLDAQQVTQRICGVCPVEHAISSVLAQDQAYGVTPPNQGLLIRNLAQAANFLQSHIVHFYTLSAIDFIDITAVLQYQGSDAALNYLKAWVQSEISSNNYYPAAPFLPRFDGDYLADLDLNLGAIRIICAPWRSARKPRSSVRCSRANCRMWLHWSREVPRRASTPARSRMPWC